MAFRFRLQPVLNLRQQERSRIQQSFALAQKIVTTLNAERHLMMESRLNILSEIRKMKDGGLWDTSRMSHLHCHADHLRQDIHQLDASIFEASQQLELEREQLLSAEQSVQALERLMQKQIAEYRIQERRIETRENDDAIRTQYWSVRKS